MNKKAIEVPKIAVQAMESIRSKPYSSGSMVFSQSFLSAVMNALAERVNSNLKEKLPEEVYPTLTQPQVAKAISIYQYQRPPSSVDL